MKVLLAGASGLLGHALRRGLFQLRHGARAGTPGTAGRRRDGMASGAQRALIPSVLRDVVPGLPIRSQPRPSTVERPGQARHRREPRPASCHSGRALAETPHRPSVYVTASGAGCYGDTGRRVIDESALYGNTFLAGVCRLWEGAADPAVAAGVRVVHLRSGPVLAPTGDLMKRLKPIIWLGLGGRLGSGESSTSRGSRSPTTSPRSVSC